MSSFEKKLYRPPQGGWQSRFVWGDVKDEEGFVDFVD